MEFDRAAKSVRFTHQERMLMDMALPPEASLDELPRTLGVVCDRKSQAGVDAYDCLDNVLAGARITHPSRVYLRFMQLDVLANDIDRLMRQAGVQIDTGQAKL